MNEVRVTASAWVVVEPPGVRLEPPYQTIWELRAEASVADDLGEPVSSLARKAWNVHVTDAFGNSFAPKFTVAKVVASGQQVAGFYLISIADLRTPLWVSPTAFGIVIDTTGGSYKRELRGQVVVPIRVQGPTIVQALTNLPTIRFE